MLQAMFADRLKLKVHRETRETPVYSLVTGKNGPKLSHVEPDGASGGVIIDGAVQQFLSEQEAPAGWSMPKLAAYLSDFAGRPVFDKTGIEGTFGFTLIFARADGDDRPDIFTAVQEQLGLKLEAAKEPLEFVIIDHVERPNEN